MVVLTRLYLVPSDLDAGVDSSVVDPDKELGVFGSTRFGTINGHACHTITGTAVMILSGRRHNEQAVTFIDAESPLIRRVFEDTPKGIPGNTFSRLTITLDPRANPPLEDGRFQFKVPSPDPRL